MTRRLSTVLSLILLLLLSTTTTADNEASEATNPERLVYPTLEAQLWLRPFTIPSHAPHDLIQSVTMGDLPKGSLNYQFHGLQRFAVRHARSQYRRFVRQAERQGWYVRPDDTFSEPLFDNKAERDFVGGFNNGAWWQRSWLDSLPEVKGGAPEEPLVHNYGSDTSWSIGPLTWTNGLNLQFNYIAFLELNPNPVETQGAKTAQHATLDISAPHRSPETRQATSVSFDVKPRVRVGMPLDGVATSVLRGISLRGSVDILHHGVAVIHGEAEIAWDPNDGIEFTFELALVRW